MTQLTYDPRSMGYGATTPEAGSRRPADGVSRPPEGQRLDVQRIRVVIAKDHELITQGVASMLSDTPEMQFVHVDEKTALPTVDIMLFDPHLRRSTGSDLGGMLRRGRFGQLVVYTWTLNPAPIELAKQAGVRGYLSKNLTRTALVESLTRIHRGEHVFPSNSDDGVTPETQRLSPRELEVVALITAGLANEEISRELFLSINSVKSYIRSAYRKMGVTSRSRAVLWGLRHQLTGSCTRILLEVGRYPS